MFLEHGADRQDDDAIGREELPGRDPRLVFEPHAGGRIGLPLPGRAMVANVTMAISAVRMLLSAYETTQGLARMDYTLSERAPGVNGHINVT